MANSSFSGGVRACCGLWVVECGGGGGGGGRRAAAGGGVAASTAKAHVPYYESKLTMLLQPALGGKARTTVVVTASADERHGDETLHALRYAPRRGESCLNMHCALF